MRETWPLRLLVLLVALSAGCAPRGGDDATGPARSPLAPTFAPAHAGTAQYPPTSGSDKPVAAATKPSASGTGATGGTTTNGSTPDPAPIPSAHVTDPAGDLTLSPTDPPPSWADLRGATLRRLGTELELVIDVDGDTPAQATDADHTMNIASFYDLDGDGQVDAEIWVNLADNGWGGAYYDDRGHTAAFARESQVTVRVEQQRIIISFPAAHLHDAGSFRWSIASEWGRFEAIGTPVAARDDAPGDDVAVEFPG
jgi:hypothetical protein